MAGERVLAADPKPLTLTSLSRLFFPLAATSGPDQAVAARSPAGHKASYLMPPKMAFHGELPLCTVHPKTSPGDIIIFCGMGSVHGVGQWRSEHQRRIVILN